MQKGLEINQQREKLQVNASFWVKLEIYKMNYSREQQISNIRIFHLK